MRLGCPAEDDPQHCRDRSSAQHSCAGCRGRNSDDDQDSEPDGKGYELVSGPRHTGYTDLGIVRLKCRTPVFNASHDLTIARIQLFGQPKPRIPVDPMLTGGVRATCRRPLDRRMRHRQELGVGSR